MRRPDRSSDRVGETLYCSLRADRHEHRRFNRAMGGMKQSSSGACLGTLSLDFESQSGHGQLYCCSGSRGPKQWVIIGLSVAVRKQASTHELTHPVIVSHLPRIARSVVIPGIRCNRRRVIQRLG